MGRTVKIMELPLGRSEDVSEFLDLILTEYSYSRESVIHYTFLLEEALIKWRETFPGDTPLIITRSEGLRDVRFDITLKGKKCNPFLQSFNKNEASDSSELPLFRMQELLLAGVGSEFRWQYKQGTNRLRGFFPRKNPESALFTRNFLLLALPIILQSVFDSLANYTDAMMLSFQDTLSMSAVSLMTEFFSVFTLLMIAVVGASTILIAQLWSKRNHTAVNEVVRTAMGLSLGCGLLFAVLAWFFSYPIASFFTDVEQVRILGAGYLKFLAPSFLFTAIYSMMFGCFRIMGEVKTAMRIGIIGCIINVALNAILIYGLFGLTPMGVSGAAYATLAGTFFQCTACLLYNQKKRILSFRSLSDKSLTKELRRSFYRQFAPIAGQCFIWKGACILIVSAYGHLGADVLAAYSALNILNVLLNSVKSGIGSASKILVGASLGRNRIEEAKMKSRHTLIIGAFVCASLSLVYLICGMGLKLLPLDLSETAEFYLTYMVIAFTVNFFFTGMNGIMLEGSLRVGGDSVSILIVDAICMWGILVPLALLGPNVLHLPVLLFALLLKMDETIKFPAFLYRYKQGKWLRSLIKTS